MNFFYIDEYLKFPPITSAPKQKIGLILEKNHNFSPCAYIRIILPYFNKYRAEKVILQAIDVDDLIIFQPNLIVLHRLAIKDGKLLLFISGIKKYNIKYIYDIDDDLIGISNSNHVESNYYTNYQNEIIYLLTNASLVTVSTENLKNKFSHYNKNIILIKNYLLGELWS